MFRAGRKPALIVTPGEYPKLAVRLESAGYSLHRGLRTERGGEVEAWKRPLEKGRQIHVQVCRRRDGQLAFYAHTEPAGYGLRHLIAALLDRVSYQHGAPILRRDLAV